MLDVIKAKIAGKSPAVVEAQEAPTGLNFMDALRESVAEVSSVKKTTRKKPPAKSVKKSAKTSRKKASG